MPFVEIMLRTGKSEAYRRALGDGVHRALGETLGIPPDDHFQIISAFASGKTLITEHAVENVIHDPGYLGIARTDDVVFVRITLGAGRTLAQKRALYAGIARALGEKPGVRPQDVFTVLVETSAENWSFGNGVAQYADKPPAHLQGGASPPAR